ncbi:hypothetical protein [Salinivibrio kushneri]|uniref:hypothetical protein n=1 Tax=Salinivibrio kushneri TaxID=1908198 RepID=UPI0022B383DE|nr:hypothetical protein [Salinivibrio kushneri]WBA17119.1 hypothetical protein O4598_08160 [Salinivibrio kushneri]
MAIESLQQLGAVFLSPVLTYFNQHLLARRPTQRPLFFLAREGYWLEHAFKRYATAKGCEVDTRYMLVSRAFLFKIGIVKPATYSYSLNFTFSGSLHELMRSRYMLSDTKIRQVFSEKEFSQTLTLPKDFDKVAALLEAKIPQLTPIITASSDAYYQYLTTLGFFDHKCVDVVDIGFGGTIQTLLSLIYGLDTLGHYFIAPNPGKRQCGTSSVSMQGYLKEGVKLGEGYIPLDRSMFLEGLLTAPEGQFQDIRLSPLAHRTFDYYYGRKVASQQQFHLLKAVCEGALHQLESFAQQDITFSQREVELLYTRYVTKKGLFPSHSWPLFEIDDDIASTGTVNGIDFFGLKV